MALDRIPLATSLPTPLERADRLGAHLGFDEGRLWVKRDDVTGLAGGGNKARKLEYLCAEAIARGADTLVTGGGRQSNHVRMTAAAANKLGLGCTVVLGSGPPSHPSGNVVLDLVLGADIVWGGDLDYYATEAAIEAQCARLRDQGKRPYAMPVGGASTTGALGYVDAADEIAAQLREHGLDVGTIVTADGSGGTHAGLVAGLGDHGRVLGVDVGTRPDLDERVPEKAAEAATAAGRAAPRGTARRHRPHRPRPLRRRLRRADRRSARSARPRRAPRGAHPRPRLHGQGHGRPRRRPTRGPHRARRDDGVPPHRRDARAVHQHVRHLDPGHVTTHRRTLRGDAVPAEAAQRG
jgi:D-cysteine desulfhydrase